jgi:hypothetical protein
MAYFSNGSAGEIFDNQCDECPLGQGPCPIASVQLMYNYDQLSDGQEKLREAMTILVDDEGICQTRKQMIELENVKSAESR